MKKHLLLLLLFSISLVGFAQQNILASGNDSASASGKSTYSVGLIHYKEATGPGGSSSAGSQIPFEILETLGIDEQNLVSLSIFPNPTSDFIYVNSTEEDAYKFTLNDMSGREISSGKLNGLQTKISLNELNTSIYILNILKENTQFKSYKIIKK